MIQVAKIIHKGQEQFWQVQKTALRVLFDPRPGWALLVQPIGARKVKEMKWVNLEEAQFVWIKPYLSASEVQQ